MFFHKYYSLQVGFIFVDCFAHLGGRFAYCFVAVVLPQVLLASGGLYFTPTLV